MDNKAERFNDWDKLLMQEEIESKLTERVIDAITETYEFSALVYATEDLMHEAQDDMNTDMYFSSEDYEDMIFHALKRSIAIDSKVKINMNHSAEKLIRGLIYKEKDIDKFKERFNAYNQTLVLEGSENRYQFTTQLMDAVNKQTYLLNEYKQKSKYKQKSNSKKNKDI